jgi:hypothetical protein
LRISIISTFRETGIWWLNQEDGQGMSQALQRWYIRTQFSSEQLKEMSCGRLRRRWNAHNWIWPRR